MSAKPCCQCGKAGAVIRWSGFDLCLTHAHASKAAAGRKAWVVTDRAEFRRQARVVEAVSAATARARPPRRRAER